ncbi:MAG TPA: cytochrome c-type biogenesis protein CcmH [Ilumatobacteraceae bacterium]|nr:cytochrome c-type biogenesis protein CcmH [Ilumatobacteraceae bacterium]
MSQRPWNRAVKSRSGWIVLGLLVVVALVFGAMRDTGPLTDGERADEIAKQLACPVCAGESVFESQSNQALAIQRQITSLVQQGVYSDDEIIAYLSEQFDARTQLVPKGEGVEALVWVVPVIAGVAAVAGLAVAFRRWRLAADTVPTEADRALVAAALAGQDEDI